MSSLHFMGQQSEGERINSGWRMKIAFICNRSSQRCGVLMPQTIDGEAVYIGIHIIA
jgi:hypothetical protein